MTRAEALDRLQALFHGTHFVDLVVRRNGRDERHEGDWLHELIPLLEAGDVGPKPAPMPLPANVPLDARGVPLATGGLGKATSRGV